MTFNAWPIRDVGDGNVGWIQGRLVGAPPLIPGHGEEAARVDELTLEWERDPNINRARLYRDPLPMRLRVTRTSNVRVWVSEDVPERGTR